MHDNYTLERKAAELRQLEDLLNGKVQPRLEKPNVINLDFLKSVPKAVLKNPVIE